MKHQNRFRGTPASGLAVFSNLNAASPAALETTNRQPQTTDPGGASIGVKFDTYVEPYLTLNPILTDLAWRKSATPAGFTPLEPVTRNQKPQTTDALAASIVVRFDTYVKPYPAVDPILTGSACRKSATSAGFASPRTSNPQPETAKPG